MPFNLAQPVTDAAPLPPRLQWLEADQTCAALWRSERGGAPPKRVVLADDTLTADSAYRHACAGTAMLWRGDFHNARQLLQAIARRIDQVPKRKRVKAAQPIPITEAFNLHRQAQAQRARTLGMLLVELDASYHVALRRAPDVSVACAEAWGEGQTEGEHSVVSLRELLGVTSAHEWRRVGVEIAALGEAPNNRIHPHYGVFSPVRGEYIGLVATAHLPKAPKGQSSITAFDIGTGTGVLAAVLVQRGVSQVVATELEPRALLCARENVARLGLHDQISVVQADLFPPGRASLIVCNPPWLPARPSSPLERAVYDENGQMLKGFLAGLAEHLAPGGEGWLILSNLAELLGMRTRDDLLAAFGQHGLRVVSRIDAKPQHPKANDTTDALHQARAQEVTSLWRLAVQKPDPAAGPAHEAAAD
ncbi:class I SAM-dependent methyltransferase [Rhodoferax sp.]|uniref:class I SAM-dependent methyltransferase n=1 Tax=Rhodoferax sp. TaxID=50421 RepID=UPI002721C581|nr:class I SAM-dependent methyltransferase [Rhodoferax sp.]MDO9143727.1 class I SAM-dependent methyltransferase [Rhodoferax sp.]MDP3865764.1 class I SAM-dependent methyltransferase [Rhodoferax sp.]